MPAHLGYPSETQAVAGTSGSDAARWSRTQSSFTQRNRTVIDLSKDELQQLIDTVRLVGRSNDCHYQVEDALVRIVQEALSNRCLRHHHWQMPVPMPVDVVLNGVHRQRPTRIVLRDGRSAAVTEYQVAARWNSFMKSVTLDGRGIQLLHTFNGTAFSVGCSFALDQLEAIVENLDTEVYECPTEGDDPERPGLDGVWTPTSKFFWQIGRAHV